MNSPRQSKGIAILAAAANEPGPVQLPGSRPGILAVGARSRGTVPCSFSPTRGLMTFFAPGCDDSDSRSSRLLRPWHGLLLPTLDA